MRKSFLYLLFTILLVLREGGNMEGSPYSLNRVCFQAHCVKVELARTPEERSRGLQFRTDLAEDKGLLFTFPEDDFYSFWVKDTLLALDIIWLDEFQRVVDMAQNVPPCLEDPCPQYTPTAKARYVVETKAGFVDKIYLKKGDFAEFHLEGF
jgi:hypothetical protein